MNKRNSFWTVSNTSLEIFDLKGFKEIRCGQWYLYTNLAVNNRGGLRVFIDGYILPRIRYSQEYANLVDADLVYKAYAQHGRNFIEYVKGMFTVILLDGLSISVFNDRAGMRKYYIYKEKKDFVVTNSIETIALNYELRPSAEGIALYTIMEHYIAQNTMFKNLRFSQPATMLFLAEVVTEGQYWNRAKLLSFKEKYYDFNEMAFKFRDIIDGYIKSFSPSDITMTLTGGNDSRAILAGLLSLDLKPRAFTFGNPDSYDGVIASRISKQESLEFNNYYTRAPSASWFGSKAQEIVEMGNTLVNVHRVHRLDAIQREVKRYPKTDMIFCGFMGGDYIKGINYDDYITAKIMRLNEYEKGNFEIKVDKVARENFLNVDKFDRSEVNEILRKQTYFTGTRKIEREFFYVYDIVGYMHDYQDTYIFDKYIPVVVNIYMDIDFLELLFESQFSMMHKDNSAKNQLKRMYQPELHCNIINILAPSLGPIEFAKNYSPNEFLGNKIIYLSKRLYRHYFGKSYPENFPYGEWFYDYVVDAMEKLENGSALLYDSRASIRMLKGDNTVTMEKQWHKYTNMINVSKNLEYYKSIYNQHSV